jgi:hypothetical protein
MLGKTSIQKRPLQLALSALIIACSVLGAWFVIESSKQTEVYLITKQNLATGAALSAEQLQTSELALFALGESYLKADQLPAGAYLSRAISAGEAIPKAAVTTQFLDDWSNIVLRPSVELSAQITAGSLVSVWASPALDYQSFGEPSIAALDVEVVQIREPEGSFAQEGKLVELRVQTGAIQSLLRAISNGDSIALLASGSSLRN